MAEYTTTLDDIIRDRAERGMSELLMALADYFYCLGAGLIPPPARAGQRDLISMIEARHRAEYLAPRGWLDPPRDPDELPGWFLAECERETALGDARPPDNWKGKP